MDAGFTRSAEIRADRQIADVVRNSFVGAGDLNIELPYGAHDDLFEYALQSAGWSTEDDDLSGVNTTTVNGSNVYTIDAGAWSTTPSVGDWVEIRGDAVAANNGYKRVTAATSTTITVGGAATSVSSAQDLTIDLGEYTTNGVTASFVTFEKQFTDLSSKYTLLKGFQPNGLNLAVATGAIMTGSVPFIGGTQTMTTADIGSGYVAVNSNEVMNAIDHVLAIQEAGADYGVTNFSFSMGNNLRAREQVATLGPISIGSGAVNLTGTNQAYYATEAVMNKFLDGTVSSNAFLVEDASGNAYVFDFPRLRYTSGQVVAGGQNGDIIADMAWEAYRDPLSGSTMRITRFAA